MMGVIYFSTNFFQKSQSVREKLLQGNNFSINSFAQSANITMIESPLYIATTLSHYVTELIEVSCVINCQKANLAV